jgi:alkylation response protein AidB-like acyl-CoA dehydrogenase
MEFGLSEDQRIFEDAIRRFVEDQAPLDRVRELAEDGTGFDETIWRALGDLGALGVLVPEEHGGSGLSFFDAALIAEALGRGAVPAPFLGSAVMAPVALAAAGTPAQKQEWLPRIASGECKVGIAVAEVTGARDQAGVTLSGGTLNGRSLFVLDALSADLFLIAAGPDNLALVPRDAAGLSVEEMPTVDRTRGIAELVLDNVRTNNLLGGQDAAGEAIRRMIDAGRVALAADTLGAAETMVQRAVAYAMERKQFGRPIGSFQAVKHMCAEMVAELEPGRSLVWYAAAAQDAVPEEAHVVACHAKSHLSEIARDIANTATLVHGGMGFTDLMGLHYWYKRIMVNRQMLGGPDRVRHEAAVAQGWAA